MMPTTAWRLSAWTQRCLATITSTSSSAAPRALNARIVRCRRPAELIAVLRDAARTDTALAHLNEVNLCTSVHRLAKLGAAWTAVPDAIRDALLRRLLQSELEARHVSNLLWAFRRLQQIGDGERRLLEHLLAQAERLVPGIRQPQLLSNLTWSLVGLSATLPASLQLVDRLGDRLGDRLLQLFTEADLVAQPTADPSAGFRLQELSNTIWALPKVGAGSPALWDALARAVPATLGKVAPGDVPPQALSNICLGFAQTPHASQAARRFVFQTVSDAVAPVVEAFSEQALSNVAWALGKTRLNVPGLLGHVALALERRPAVESVSHWVVALWALSRTRFAHEPFFLACAARLPARLAEFKDDELRSCLRSFHAAGIHAPKLFGAILQEADRRNLSLFTVAAATDAAEPES